MRINKLLIFTLSIACLNFFGTSSDAMLRVPKLENHSTHITKQSTFSKMLHPNYIKANFHKTSPTMPHWLSKNVGYNKNSFFTDPNTIKEAIEYNPHKSLFPSDSESAMIEHLLKKTKDNTEILSKLRNKLMGTIPMLRMFIYPERGWCPYKDCKEAGRNVAEEASHWVNQFEGGAQNYEDLLIQSKTQMSSLKNVQNLSLPDLKIRLKQDDQLIRELTSTIREVVEIDKNLDIIWKAVTGEPVSVTTKPTNQWGPLCNTATNVFYVPVSGKYKISGMLPSANVELCQTDFIKESYPAHVGYNFIAKVSNDSAVDLQAGKMYYFKNPVNFDEQDANIQFHLLQE